jgi:hypothetical protein
MKSGDLQEEFAPFAPLRGSSTGVVARAVVEPRRDIESLRGRMAESESQVENSFQSLLAESFGGA